MSKFSKDFISLEDLGMAFRKAKVDALFIPEWNKDTETFNPLIESAALRAFQSNHRSPNGPFKPVPDGFEDDMAHNRKVLPKR